ncbi:hypothetical protein BDY21DRAFT_334134 [Lineolata rhizophorae]|uniref:Septation initiation network scaffold protein cdc11 n=1 Tax=Lineolata rhizophorae TaxID=578093 RepID=A0A6A6PAN1_9PEZI|nr:hypothetical protein BDY21DRAFT_334134 [Lineolata rhizophorae]
MGYNDQQDLFSPIGLEKIFNKPPSVRTSKGGIGRSKALAHLRSKEPIPSSPPPWPDRNGTQQEEPIQEEESEGSVIHHSHEDRQFFEEDDKQSTSEAGEETAVRHSERVCKSAKSKRSDQSRGEETSAMPPMRETAFLDNSRTASGEFEQENESFSPVFVGKRSTSTGEINYAALDGSDMNTAGRFKRPASHGTLLDRSAATDSRQPEPSDGPSFGRDYTLPENLPAGTPDLGEFVSVKRGGFSTDGSFLRRPLSPSPTKDATDTPSRLYEDDSVLRPQGITSDTPSHIEIPPAAPTPPVVPTTPSSRRSKQPSGQSTKSSGSPLKLFADHDTFTSQKLHRRISQLEDSIQQDVDGLLKASNGSPCKKIANKSRLSSLEEVSFQKMEETKVSRTVRTTTMERHTSTGSNFGQGKLDDYRFPDDISFDPEADGWLRDHSPPPNAMPPGSRAQFKFWVESPPNLNDTFKSKKRMSHASSHRAQGSLVLKKKASRSNLSSRKPSGDTSILTEGKRPRPSPVKDPTPKRRRTLHFEDDFVPVDVPRNEAIASVRESHERFISTINSQSRKRKDARHSQDGGNRAGADILARRHILRPRNPTPSQRRQQDIQDEVLEATEAFISSSPQQLQTIQEHLREPLPPGTKSEDEQARAVASEVAAFSMRIAQNKFQRSRAEILQDETRKRSVTTQDFLDEAMKIMDYIRARARPPSGLESFEEVAELEKEYGATRDLSNLTLERPPSREGKKSGWRERQPTKLDPRVASHLRKYQEKDGEDGFMSTSLLSGEFAQVESVFSEEQPVHVQSDTQRIRITESPHPAQASNDPPSIGTNPLSRGSFPSADSSMGRTTTSRRSDNVATLAPDVVAHLIPQNVAGMTFDREKGVWVKCKKPSTTTHATEHASSLESDDDPLGQIPDLSVDETKEMEAMNLSRSRGPGNTSLERGGPASPQNWIKPTPFASFAESQAQARPITADSANFPPTVTSTHTSSHIAPFTSSGPRVETRATSWSEQEQAKQAAAQEQSQWVQPQGCESEDAEHEIKISEGRSARNETPNRIRNITISFSSPAVDRNFANRRTQTKKSQYADNNTTEADGSTADATQIHHDPGDSHVKPAGYHPGPHRGTSRFNTRGIFPHIDENTELSFTAEVPGRRQMKFAVNVSGPIATLPAAKENDYDDADESALVAPNEVPPSPINPQDVTFYLSDLPEFTMHQVDERELPESRTIVRNQGGVAERVLENRYEQGTKELVRALQDSQPDEPFWDDVRALDLHDRRLPNLHSLELFCNRIELLDVSTNSLAQLAGVPLSVRRLDASQNSLTSLTAWGHLRNLQYVDVSCNRISSLEGFAALIHLRELRIDDNELEVLDGIEHMDGLLHFSARRNRIQKVDLQGAELHRLVHLDVGENLITEVSHLEHLQDLQTLNLDNNYLSEFLASCSADLQLESLNSLRVNHNRLTSLCVSVFPRLRHLAADQNRLVNIEGLGAHRALETLSMRWQDTASTQPATDAGYSLSHLNNDLSVMHLSANKIPSFSFHQAFLNLRHLELGSAGLQTLPDDLGIQAPNIRSLNLNFNALKDLRPLLNIVKLEVLLLAGNRINRLRKNVAVLSRLEGLKELDLRSNPLTMGFYPPVHAGKISANTERRLVRPKDDDLGNILSSGTKQKENLRRNDEEEDKLLARFVLPSCNDEADQLYLETLDQDTKLRRRVYEMLLGVGCKELNVLDGLVLNRERVLVKDAIWERLVELGVLRRSQGGLSVTGSKEDQGN